MKKLIHLLVLSGLLALAVFLFTDRTKIRPLITDNKDMGEDKIVHGCNVTIGYSIDETIGACTKKDDLDQEKRDAAKVAVQTLRLSSGFNTSQAIYVIGVEILRCPKCYEVILDAGEVISYKIIVTDGVSGNIRKIPKDYVN